MNDQSTTAIETHELDAVDDTSDIDIVDDYETFRKFIAEEEDGPLPSRATTGLPGGGVAFSNRRCRTDEEAEAAHLTFLREVLELTDEEMLELADEYD